MTGGSNRQINTNSELNTFYHDLQSGDIINCRIKLKPQEEHLLLDLVERGIVLHPSATAQLASRSKVFQSLIFKDFLVPHTVPVYDRHVLMETISCYNRNMVTKTVLKTERKNCGMGIHLFNSPEDVFNMVELGNIGYPFVLQPFLENCTDMRVIVIGDYIEAYSRKNRCNFRNNLHCGSSSTPCSLDRQQLNICHRVMKRGKFPYAHIDLVITPDESSYLLEINLRGGLKGASITPEDYQRKIDAVHQNFLVAQP